MNCGDAERLFDAYLDGHLSGTLRLELDAHRLRCSHCQQTLAMLESCGHVIATDRRMPSLRSDFADRVMAEVAAGRADDARIFRLRFRRVGLTAAAAMQVAAILLLAVMLRDGTGRNTRDLNPADVRGRDVAFGTLAPDPGELAREVYAKVRLGWERTTDRRVYASLGQFFNIVPDSMARAAADPNGALLMNIFQFDLVAPAASEAAEGVAEESSRFAL